MKFITTSQTPLYKIGSTGFYSAASSIPAGTEVEISTTGIDPKSDRQIGTLESGEIIYLDSLTKVLDEVEVKATFLWGWMAGIAIALLIIFWIILKQNN